MVDDSGRPAKRLRMEGPDGFLSPTKGKKKAKPRSSLPMRGVEFAFEDKENSDLRTPSRPKSKPLNAPKHNLDEGLLTTGSKGNKPLSSRVNHTPKPVSFHGKENTPIHQAESGRTLSSVGGPLAQETPRKPSTSVTGRQFGLTTPHGRTPVTPSSALQSRPYYKVRSAPALQIPETPVQLRTPRTPWKQLQPPALPPPAPETPVHPQTINSTRFARGTDLTSEDGTFEVASILLGNTCASRSELPFTTGNAKDNEHVRRGFDMSPQKGVREGPGFKKCVYLSHAFIAWSIRLMSHRNGLAAFASSVFSEIRTEQNLWLKDTTRSLAMSTRPDKLQPSLRLRILRIIPSYPTFPSTCAVCIDSSAPSPPSSQERPPSPMDEDYTPSPPFPFSFAFPKAEPVKVLLYHSGLSSSSLAKLVKGAVIWAWDPIDAIHTADDKTLILTRFLVADASMKPL
jgi:hypothetical protein